MPLPTFQAKGEQNLGEQWVLFQQWNFTSQVPDEIKETYFKTLFIAAKGDQKLSEAERIWILGYASAVGVKSSVIESLKTYSADEDIEQVIKNSDELSQLARNSILYDAIRAASADAELSPGEYLSIYKIATALKLSKESVDQIASLVKAENALQELKLAYLVPSGLPH